MLAPRSFGDHVLICVVPSLQPPLYHVHYLKFSVCSISGGCKTIANKDPAKPLSLAAGSFVAAFGPGSFALAKGSEALTERQVEYSLANHNTLVVLNNTVLPLGKVLKDHRETKPDALIIYYKINCDPATPNEFTLEATHRLMFALKEEPAEVSIHNVAGKAAMASWATEATEILWVVRWTQKGLTPVRPAVYMKGAVSLPPGHACYLNTDSEAGSGAA